MPGKGYQPGMARSDLRRLIESKKTYKRDLRQAALMLLEELEKADQLLRRIHEQHGLGEIRVSTSNGGCASVSEPSSEDPSSRP